MPRRSRTQKAATIAIAAITMTQRSPPDEVTPFDGSVYHQPSWEKTS